MKEFEGKKNSDGLVKKFLGDIYHLDVNPITLKFRNGSKEEKYIDFYDKTSLLHIRTSLILGLFVYSSFGILDVLIGGDMTLYFLFLRFPVAMGFNLITIGLTFVERMRGRIQLIVAMDVLVSGLAIVGMIIISVPPTSYYYYAGLILVIFYMSTIIRLRHTYSIPASILVMISYEIGAILMGTPRMIFISNNFFFIFSFFIGAIASYLIELYSRRDYHLTGQLKSEKEKVEKANRELELKIGERTADIRRSMDELTYERNRAELYMDLITHDMGNINQGLLQSIQLAQYLENRPEKRKLVLERSVSLVKRGSRIISNTQKLSTLRSKEIDNYPVDPVEFIMDTFDRIREEEGDDNINLILNEKNPGIKIIADKDLQSVFYNLIHNAVKAQKGGKSVVEVSIGDNGSHVPIRISDHGKGIPDSFKRILFNRTTMTDRKLHSGIGLTLVKSLTDRFGARIWIEDRIEGDHSKGASFVVEFIRARS
jgi:signal transduction histidine kinase